MKLREFLESPEKEDLLKMVGVYKIFQNYPGGKSYIGSTKRSLGTRLQEHLESLEAGTHHNPRMKNSYKANPRVFSFEILEAYPKDSISVDRLIWRENCWIETAKPEFNMIQDADYRKHVHRPPERWLLKSPEGETFKVESLDAFCKEFSEKHPDHKLQARYLSDLARGKKKIYKGWQCTEINRIEDQSTTTTLNTQESDK